LISQFCGLYKKALVKERYSLMQQLKDTESSWQRWAWIIERKFDDWNLKKKSEVS